MTMTGDLDAADHSAEHDDAKSHEKTKRGRLKDAIHRTKFIIAEARKNAHLHEKQTGETPANNDLDAFLAAGRVFNASDTALTEHTATLSDRSTPPRPSTSDSKSQSSPKRVPIPRIDVSTSQRFPNAKEVRNNGPIELPGSSAPSGASTANSLLLKPEYKARSQSVSALASPGRKARIRGLSVGFVNSPPVIIGEGGDEAEAPTVEISRAKSQRTRSASPQTRVFRSGPDMPSESTRRVPGREGNDTSVNTFNPKPASRVQTGAFPTSPQSSTGCDTFVPKPLGRNQTGLSDANNPAFAHRPPPIPTRNKPLLPPDLGKSQKVTTNPTQEFEMSLGFKPANPLTKRSPDAQESRIFAPKPQRAAPSYDLIEGGRREHTPDRGIESPSRQSPVQTPQARVPNEQSPQQSSQSFQRVPRQSTQQEGQKRIPIVHELPSPQEVKNTPKPQHYIAPQQIQSPQVQQAPQAHLTQHTPLPQQRQQHPIPQRIGKRTSPQFDQNLPQLNLQHQHLRQSSQSPQVRSPQHVSASQQDYHQVPQRVEQPASQPISSQPITRPTQQPVPQPITQHVGQQLPQPTNQQQQLSGYGFSQHLELPAEPVQRTGEHEQIRHSIPEFEHFLRLPLLQDGESVPNPKISRFASLHTPNVRRSPNSSQDRLNFYDQPPNSNLRILPPLDTSSDHNTYHSPAQRSKPNPRPISLHSTPTMGTPLTPTIRQVSPSGNHDSNSSNYSSAVQSPHSAADPVANRMRFYESINKGNPPTGYI